MHIAAPVRVTRSYVQRLRAAPSDVFLLLCPVREAEWIEGWDPIAVWSDSGVAEPDCIFTTASDDGDSIWYITQHSPGSGHVEMLKITPGVTACRIGISLSASDDGTSAEVTYSHTSLGPAGDELITAFTEEYYIESMRRWESRLNHYLASGGMLRGKDQ